MSFQPQTDYPGAVACFKGEACFTLDYSRDRILHCLAQVTDEQAWSRPHPAMNSVANVVLHLCGNLTQWITVGCDPTQARADQRDRPAEFAATFESTGYTTQDLADQLTAAVDAAKATIESMSKDHFLESRFIQITNVTGMGAVWHSVAHLEGHAQETIYATRLMLGDAYRFKDEY